jgi:hypothetical protein
MRFFLFLEVVNIYIDRGHSIGRLVDVTESILSSVSLINVIVVVFFIPFKVKVLRSASKW